MRFFLLVIASTTVLMTSNCGKNKINAAFSIQETEVPEGLKFRPVNQSEGADRYKWSITPGNWTSSEREPEIFFEDTGVYELKLTCENRKETSASSVKIRVKADTMWRLSGAGRKVWNVESILYGGAELLNQPCQKDDEFALVHGSTDTFSFTEGSQKCPDGTYIFTIPASGAWRFNRAKKSLDFSLTAFGSPYSFEFVTTKLTKDEFEGRDTKNDVVLKLKRQ